jgi:DNA-binding ferritin-like protein
LNQDLLKELKNEFKEQLEIDIEEMAERISPLGFRLHFTNEKNKETKIIRENDGK